MWDECGIGLCATMLKMLGRCGIFTGPHNFYNFFSFLSDLGIWGLIYGQGCINHSILPSGMGARGVGSEHVENMEMFSGSPLRYSPVLQLRCALVLGEPCSGSRRNVLQPGWHKWL